MPTTPQRFGRASRSRAPPPRPLRRPPSRQAQPNGPAIRKWIGRPPITIPEPDPADRHRRHDLGRRPGGSDLAEDEPLHRQVLAERFGDAFQGRRQRSTGPGRHTPGPRQHEQTSVTGTGRLAAPMTNRIAAQLEQGRSSSQHRTVDGCHPDGVGRDPADPQLAGEHPAGVGDVGPGASGPPTPAPEPDEPQPVRIAIVPASTTTTPTAPASAPPATSAPGTATATGNHQRVGPRRRPGSTSTWASRRSSERPDAGGTASRIAITASPTQTTVMSGASRE